MKRRRHTSEQIVRKLREADRLLGEEKELAVPSVSVPRCPSCDDGMIGWS